MGFSIFGRPRSGGSINEAAVNEVNQLEVRAVSERDIEFVSDAFGLAFAWISSDAAASGEESIYIQNGDAQRELHITQIHCQGSIDAIYDLIGVTSTTAAAGTNITAKSLNRQFNIIPDGVFKGDAEVTGSLTGDLLMRHSGLANTTVDIAPAGGVILGKGNAIAVRQDGTNTLKITVIGFYEKKAV